MEYLQVGGISVRYSDSGSGDPALLIHGLGGSIESWTNNLPELEKSMRVIALDLPGFGLSDKPKMSYTIRFYRDFLARFLKELNLNQVSVVGSSLGGHVAAEMAIGMPDLVKRLVMISPPGALPSSFKGTPALRRYAKVINAKSVEQVKKALQAVDNKPVDDSYAQIVFQKMSMPGARDAFVSALMGSARAPRLNSRLNRIKAPAMLLWGKDDIMIPARFVEPFMNMKNCRIVMLEHCGHRPHVDRPALFNKLVADFLAELSL